MAIQAAEGIGSFIYNLSQHVANTFDAATQIQLAQAHAFAAQGQTLGATVNNVGGFLSRTVGGQILAYGVPQGSGIPVGTEGFVFPTRPATNADYVSAGLEALSLGAAFVPLLSDVNITLRGLSPEAQGIIATADALGPYGRFGNAENLAGVVLDKYQAFYNESYGVALDSLDDGSLKVPIGLSKELVIGNRTDRAALFGLRDFLNNEGVIEGPNGVIQLNRRLYDPLGSGSYRVPDVRIPDANLIIDGTTGLKFESTPQVRDFIDYSGHDVTIVRPEQIGDPFTYSIRRTR